MPYKNIKVQREYQRQWMKERRSSYLDGKTCIDCGSRENLEIDHIDRKLKVSHRVWSWSEKRRHEELSKCVIRCAVCHQNKTNKDLDYGYIVHGSMGRGYKRGCRCPLCKRANADKQRQRRSKKISCNSESSLVY